MLFFPLPGIFQKLFAGNILFADAHIAQLGYHLVFCCYGGVVGAGHPAGVLAVHTCLAHQHIVYCIVQHVAHMQYARHIWRGNNYGVGFA